MTLTVRPPAVAGLFYPDDPTQLAATVDRDIAAARPSGPTPKAVIAPHAGYAYSGPVAGSAYAQLAAAHGTVSRVLLLGPAHRVPVDGMALPGVDAFDTPLGPVAVDDEARSVALAHPAVHIDDHAHAPEHSLEVHLPFLVRALGPEIRVLPIVVGRVPATDVADLLDLLWGGPETVIVVSSDLSHYLSYEAAVERDRSTADAITGRRVTEIGPYDACGAYPVAGLLEAAKRHGLGVTAVDLRNSGDTAGDRSRVVGYGAFVLS